MHLPGVWAARIDYSWAGNGRSVGGQMQLHFTKISTWLKLNLFLHKSLILLPFEDLAAPID